MKFTFSALKKLIETDKTPLEVADTLINLGIEVESIHDQGAELAPFKIARIVDVTPHPDADRLQICLVDYGEKKSDPLQIVCGAPNARAGIKVVLALPGVIIPSTGDKIRKGRVRGVESAGMLCSSKELGLGEDHAGIIELDPTYEVGLSFASVVDTEVIFDISITPNRGDCFSVYGIARDLAAKGIGHLKEVSASPLDKAKESHELVKITSANCHAFGAVLIENVDNKPSPKWLQDYLKHAGMKSISALVDVTNFISHYYGRPLHVFDADKLSGSMIVRDAYKGETIKALDEITYTLTNQEIVVADQKNPQAIAGIMGGLHSGCQPSTTRVILEGAIFSPEAIMRSGQRLAIHSEARLRFERGVDANFTLNGISLAATMILELCGGSISKWQWLNPKPHQDAAISFNPDNYSKQTGCKANVQQGKNILTNLGMHVDDSDPENWKIIPPSWRHDITCQEDIIEEWLRISGYENLPVVSLPPAKSMVEQPNSYLLEKTARRVLTTIGYDEAITWSFTSEILAKEFSNSSFITLSNPLSQDQAIMRPCSVMSLHEVAMRNYDYGEEAGNYFEIGKSYLKTNESIYDEQPCITGLIYGMNHQRHWQKKQESVDFYRVKSDVLQLFEAWGLPTANLTWSITNAMWLHPGQGADVSLGKNIIAKLGILHPRLTKKTAMVGFEIYLDKLPPVKNKLRAKVVSEFPTVKRDFAFIVKPDFCADDLCRVIRRVDQNFIKDAYVFDNYIDPETKQRSVAVEVVMQSEKETLNEDMIKPLTVLILKVAHDKCGATLKI